MKKIEKLHRNTWNKSGTKYREEMIFEKLEEVIDQLGKQKQLNKTFSERLGLDPDDDRLNEEKCACGEETTFGGADVEIGGVCHRVNKPCFFIEKPDEECECGGRVTLEKVCEHCGIFYHPMGESKLKLQRLLEWVEGNFIVPQDDVTPICVSRIDLKAKIKELMDEE